MAASGGHWKSGSFTPSGGRTKKQARSDFESFISRQPRQTREQLMGVMNTLSERERVNFMRGVLMFPSNR